MRKFAGADEISIGPANTKARLVLMTVAAIGLVGVLFYLQISVVHQSEELPEKVPFEPAVIELPAVFPGTFDDVADADERDRIHVEAPQLTVVRAAVRSTTAHAIATAGSETLAGGVRERVLADPAPERGTYFCARGEVVALAQRETGPGSDGPEWTGTVRTGDGEFIHFRSGGTDDSSIAVGEWARVDGMFFKLLIQDVADEPRLGPLLVGPQMLRSFPDFGEVTSFDPLLWDEVRDDSLSRPTGPRDAFRWRLLAWMRDAAPDQLPALEAGELDDATLSSMTANGTAYRGKRFVTPVCRVQATAVKASGENPARLDRFSEVWIGNNMWTHQYVVMVQIPGAIETLPLGSLVTAELVYYMNVAYDTGNERRIAPMFVASALTPFTPPRETLLKYLLLGFSALLAVIVVVIAVLVRRDQRRSRVLADKLVQRRRARREKVPARV